VCDCVQWWRAVLRCQTRLVQENSVMPQLVCQSLESLSLLWSSSLLLPLSPALLQRQSTTPPITIAQATESTEHATVAERSTTAITVPGIEVAATAITTDPQRKTT